MYQKSSYILAVAALILGLVVGVSPTSKAEEAVGGVPATPQAAPVEQDNIEESKEKLTLPVELQLNRWNFVYQVTGRPDPFMPFLETHTKRQESEEELSGMRRFEPGQLALTAIIIGERETWAMVEDASGRGHVIQPGTLIGRKGRVASISSGLVVIKEPTTSPTGETGHRTIEILLNKEGDKQE